MTVYFFNEFGAFFYTQGWLFYNCNDEHVLIFDESYRERIIKEENKD